MTNEEIISLVRDYLNMTDSARIDKLDDTQFEFNQLTAEKFFKANDALRNLVLTDNDKELIRQAEKLHVANYWDGDKLKERCDTTTAWKRIDEIMIYLHHREEAMNDMI